MATYKVTYTKRIGGNGAIIVRASSEDEAISNAKYLCYTGSDFRDPVLVDINKYRKPKKQGFNSDRM